MSTPFQAPHAHVYLGRDHRRNERRVWRVIALTAAMMGVEIVAGTVYGSMALVADGWHMSTHAGAMLITALAYRYARRNAGNPRFAFGTGTTTTTTAATTTSTRPAPATTTCAPPTCTCWPMH
jgi:Co/Zn/Cd efflux system component